MELEHRVFATDRLSRREPAPIDCRRGPRRVIVAESRRRARRRCGRAVPAGRRRWRGSIRSRSRRIWPAAASVGAARGGRSRGARARLRLACGSKCTSPKHAGDLPLPQERLPGVRPSCRATTRTAATRCGSRNACSGAPGLAAPPRYFHQTTEFTCGPACIMMALAWADPAFKPSPALEFQLWREATTIFMTSGPGGCEPFGLAVTLKRRGLVRKSTSAARSLFSRTVRIRQAPRHAADTASFIAKPRHRYPQPPDSGERIGSDVRIRAGSVAIVLVSGYHMVPQRRPHWVFAFGRDGRHVLMHDPAAVEMIRDGVRA